MKRANYIKGYCFEDFISEKLDRDSCLNVNWKNRMSDKKDCSDIDFSIMSEGEVIDISLQCKYRASNPLFFWWDDKKSQILEYRSYAKKHNRRFFVVLGMGTHDPNTIECFPKHIYIVPLCDIPIDGDDLPLSFLEPYEVLDLNSKLVFLPKKRVFLTRGS